MKKLLTLLVLLSFTVVASASDLKDDPEFQKAAKEFQAKVKAGEVQIKDLKGSKIYSKKKEHGLLKSSSTQVPHLPYDQDDVDVVVWEEDFESANPVFTSGWLYSSTQAADTTTFNAFKGEGGEYSWWVGTNNPTYLQPGYGDSWGIALQHNQTSFQLQGGLNVAAIQFDGFYNIEPGWDGMHLQVSTDSGATWTFVECWSGASNGWVQNISVDVSDFIGEWITFRFVFLSDGAFSSEDGEVGSFENPGGFFIDNLKLMRNGVPELVSDGGDNKYQMSSYDLHFGPFPLPAMGSWVLAEMAKWGVTTAKSASPTHSLGFAVGNTKWNPGTGTYARTSYQPLDLPALGGNPAAPLWLDFNVLSTIPGADADGAFDYWTPIVRASFDGVSYATYFLKPTSAYTTVNDGGDFIAFSDAFGYIDVSDFAGAVDASFGIAFFSEGGCVFGEGDLYFDDFVVIQKNDPYEWNDYCDTASLIEYGHVTTFANTWDAADVDYYYFEGEEGDWVDIYSESDDTDLSLALLPQVGAFNSVIDNSSCGSPMVAGDACCPMYSEDDGELYDRVIWRLPYTGGYFIEVYSTAGDSAQYTMYLDRLENNAVISSITDIDGDQGKNVLIEFEAPELDNYQEADFGKWGAHTVSFQIERKKNVIANEWDIVGQFEAFGLSPDGQAYKVPAATKYDSSATYFRVRTKTGYLNKQGIYSTTSEQASGTSYDNIAPSFIAEYTLAPESGEGVDVGAEVDYGGGFSDSMTDIAFYNIYRSDAAGFTPSAANKIATIETHNAKIRYNDVDYDGSVEYYYVIEVVDDGGNKVYSAEVSTTTSVENEAVPTVYSLAQNYPNPFNPATTIKFGIPQAADVTIKIYDILGQEVQTLVNRNLAAGFHTVNFNASNLISGMYIYRIQANGVDGSNFTDVKKMLLVK